MPTKWKNLRHKAKKGMMKKLGSTRSTKEDPVFTAVLFSIEKLNKEVTDMKQKATDVAAKGKAMNVALEHFCGSSVMGEDLFIKQCQFIHALNDCLCHELDKIVTEDIPKMEEIILEYKGCKLSYDTSRFKTEKDMEKKGISVTGKEEKKREEIHQHSTVLPGLWEEYQTSKKQVLDHRLVMQGRLENDIIKALRDVDDASGAPHHKLYIEYFRKRVITTSTLCNSGTISSRESALPIKPPLPSKPKPRVSEDGDPLAAATTVHSIPEEVKEEVDLDDDEVVEEQKSLEDLVLQSEPIPEKDNGENLYDEGDPEEGDKVTGDDQKAGPKPVGEDLPPRKELNDGYSEGPRISNAVNEPPVPRYTAIGLPPGGLPLEDAEGEGQREESAEPPAPRQPPPDAPQDESIGQQEGEVAKEEAPGEKEEAPPAPEKAAPGSPKKEEEPEPPTKAAPQA